MLLNKQIREEILSENYIMFNKLIKFFRLNCRIKRGTMLAKNNIWTIISENLQINMLSKSQQFHPFVYYTDGGCYLDEYNSYMSHIFVNNSTMIENNHHVVYKYYITKCLNETQIAQGVHVQAYIGRKASHGTIMPKEFRK